MENPIHFNLNLSILNVVINTLGHEHVDKKNIHYSPTGAYFNTGGDDARA